MGYHVECVSSRAVSSWSRSPGGGGCRGVFWVGRIFFVFIFFFISSNAHGLLPVRGHLASCTSLVVYSTRYKNILIGMSFHVFLSQGYLVVERTKSHQATGTWGAERTASLKSPGYLGAERFEFLQSSGYLGAEMTEFRQSTGYLGG